MNVLQRRVTQSGLLDLHVDELILLRCGAYCEVQTLISRHTGIDEALTAWSPRGRRRRSHRPYVPEFFIIRRGWLPNRRRSSSFGLKPCAHCVGVCMDPIESLLSISLHDKPRIAFFPCHRHNGDGWYVSQEVKARSWVLKALCWKMINYFATGKY